MTSLDRSGYVTGLVWCSIVLCVALARSQPRDPIGRVAALEGRVMIRHKGSTQAERLQAQSLVYQEDLIQTMAASKVKLVLVDETMLTLGPKGALRLTEYVYKPQQQTQKSALKAFFGVLRVVAKKVLPSGTFEVHTSNAVAAVRGTDWMARVTLNTTAVVVLEGAVAVTHKRHDVVGEAILTADMGTDVRGDRPPTPPKKWGDARVHALLRATTLP